MDNDNNNKRDNSNLGQLLLNIRGWPVLSAYKDCLDLSSQQLSEVVTITIFILQMKRLSFREVQ